MSGGSATHAPWEPHRRWPWRWVHGRPSGAAGSPQGEGQAARRGERRTTAVGATAYRPVPAARAQLEPDDGQRVKTVPLNGRRGRGGDRWLSRDVQRIGERDEGEVVFGNPLLVGEERVQRLRRQGDSEVRRQSHSSEHQDNPTQQHLLVWPGSCAPTTMCAPRHSPPHLQVSVAQQRRVVDVVRRAAPPLGLEPWPPKPMQRPWGPGLDSSFRAVPEGCGPGSAASWISALTTCGSIHLSLLNGRAIQKLGGSSPLA